MTSSSKYKGHKIVRYSHGNGLFVIYNQLGHSVGNGSCIKTAKQLIDKRVSS